MVKEPADDLEAVRSIAQMLDPFETKDRERILRWVRERLGMPIAVGQSPAPPPGGQPAQVPPPAGTPPAPPTTDIKSFIEQKKPRDSLQLAAVVAYYYQFQAPEGQRQETITKEDLVEACRLAVREQPLQPGQTLINAYHGGFFDRPARGQYRLNTVGENLVAMVLPEGESARSSNTSTGKRLRKTSKKGGRQTSRKKTAKKKK